MNNQYEGELSLIIWNMEKTTYTPLYKSNVSFPFQPEKGMRVCLEANLYVIHDIEWDMQNGTFEAKIIQRERHAGTSFLSMEFFAEEAELVGWQRAKALTGRLIENPSEEFKDYCFPDTENKYIEELEKLEAESRFREAVLNFLTSLKEQLEKPSKIIGRVFFVGVAVGVLVSAVISRLL